MKINPVFRRGLHNKNALLIVPLLLLLLLCLSLYIKGRGEGKRAFELKRQLAQMQELRKDYIQALGEAEEYRKRIFLKEQNISVALEGILDGLHLKEKLSSIKPTIQKDIGKYRIDGAEVRMERLTLNETVNLLYAMEQGPEGFIVRSLKMKKDFSQPEKLNITFEVSILRIKTLSHRFTQTKYRS